MELGGELLMKLEGGESLVELEGGESLVELEGGELLVKMVMLKKMEVAYYDALSNY